LSRTRKRCCVAIFQVIPSYCTLQVAYAIGDRIENNYAGFGDVSSIAVRSNENMVVLLSSFAGVVDKSCVVG